jgi:hypothetical protein
MYASTWLRNAYRPLFGHRPAGRRPRPSHAHARCPFRPRLESLEERVTPATYSVTPAGTGLNSLAGAVAQANLDKQSDTIMLAPGQYNLSGQLKLSNPYGLTIEGTAPSAGATVIDAGGISRAFLVKTVPPFPSGLPLSFTFQDLTIQNGVATDDGQSGPASTEADGGGILALDVKNVTLNSVVLQNNIAQAFPGDDPKGGGVYFSTSDGLLTITKSVIQNNKALGSSTPNGAKGGGIYTDNPVAISGSTLSGNLASGDFADGGGAWFANQAVLVNSTIAGNVASVAGFSANGAHGGGLFFSKGMATLTNVTVAYNQAQGPGGSTGGGIEQVSGANPRLTLVNTLVALNHADGNVGHDYNGDVTQSDHNLIGNADGSFGFSAARGDRFGSTANPLDPKLGQLADNGGPTPTVALLSGSPAIDAGDDGAQPTTGPNDQRGAGYARAVNGTIDIGAFEFGSAPPSGGGGGPSGPTAPPTLHTPFLLALFDELLHGNETVNANGTETVTDNFFGFDLVSTYDGAGHLEKVTFLGFDVTVLFE